MSTFLMFGNYTQDSVGRISARRSDEAQKLVKDLGGEVDAGYALLGKTDVLLVVDFPSVERAMKASVELAKLLGISFTTSPAVSMEDFDKLIEG
jgi:uncharacterized protein with GYD domain